jgi:iron complex outermembrane recepter protein
VSRWHSARDEAEREEVLREVVVTGSRIAAPNLTSTSPIQVVDSREIQQTGKNDVSDILFRLPQNFNNSLGQDFSNNTSGLSAAGGLSTADLRGLGGSLPAVRAARLPVATALRAN